jgi:uncharacterized protein
MTAVADTGFIVAVAITTDKHHASCLAQYKRERVIYVPQTTLAETAYFLTRAGGNHAIAGFLSGLSSTKYRVIPLELEDIIRTAELLTQYADTRVDFVDATVAAVAERLDIRRILTIDKRDFQIIRPRHTDYFELLP